MKITVIFTRQLTEMLRGGLTLVQSMSQLKDVFPHRRFAKAAETIALGLEQGYSLHLLLQAHPRLFPPFYYKMVEVGEMGDSILPALDTLAGYYSEQELVKKRIARIMFYPTLLLSIAIGSGLFALWHVVPTFSSLYSALGAAVPPATVRVFAASTIFTPLRVLIAFLLICVVLVTAFFSARRKLDWPELARIPMVGTLSCYWFCRVTAMVTGAGHTLELALIMAAEVSDRGPAPVALARLREGESLYQALAGCPKLLRAFVATGEISGNLPEALARAADYYQAQVQESLDNFQRILEPVAMLMVGTVVASMLLILMLPMLQLAQVF